MTRKDYKLIADIIASFKDADVRLALGFTFSKRLAENYENFNSAEFARAIESKGGNYDYRKLK